MGVSGRVGVCECVGACEWVGGCLWVEWVSVGVCFFFFLVGGCLWVGACGWVCAFRLVGACVRRWVDGWCVCVCVCVCVCGEGGFVSECRGGGGGEWMVEGLCGAGGLCGDLRGD